MEVRVIAKEKELRELTGGLEQQIMERTKELERTKQNLEEMNLMLEIRVKARIHEFKRLNQTLEKKVIERTNDLQRKIKDLETFQRITVGREMKMMEELMQT